MAPLVVHGPEFWEEKIRDEVERESQEELKELEERGVPLCSTVIRTRDTSETEDEDEQQDVARSSSPSPSPRKKRMVIVSTPPTSPSLDKGKGRQTWAPSLVRPFVKHLQSISNVVASQVLPTPPPTSPSDSPSTEAVVGSPSILSSSMKLAQTLAKAQRPDDSGVCLSPSFPPPPPSSVFPSHLTTSKTPRLIFPVVPARQEASTSSSSNSSPRKRPRPTAVDASPSTSNPFLPPLPPSPIPSIHNPLPSIIGNRLPSKPNIPTITLAQLLQSAPIFVPPSHNITFKSLNPTSLPRSAIDLLPFPQNLQPTLNALLDSPSPLLGGVKVVLLSSDDVSTYLRDLEEIKAEVSKRKMGKLLVVDVWCLKWVPRKGEVEAWRRGLFWESP